MILGNKFTTGWGHCIGCFSVQIRFMDTFASKYFINYCLHRKQDRGILSLKSNMNLLFCAVWAVRAVKRRFLQYCKNILLLRVVFENFMGKKINSLFSIHCSVCTKMQEKCQFGSKFFGGQNRLRLQEEVGTQVVQKC